MQIQQGEGHHCILVSTGCLKPEPHACQANPALPSSSLSSSRFHSVFEWGPQYIADAGLELTQLPGASFSLSCFYLSSYNTEIFWKTNGDIYLMYELKGKIKTLLFTISFSFANFIDLSNEIRCCLAPFPSFNSLYFQIKSDSTFHWDRKTRKSLIVPFRLYLVFLSQYTAQSLFTYFLWLYLIFFSLYLEGEQS